MAMARARRDSGINSWPGFVDALSTLVLGIIFLLTVFVVVQFYLTQEVSGKDTALTRLNAQIAQLTDLLSMEKTDKLSIEEQLAQLRSSIALAETERDRYKSLYDNIGSGAASAQGQVTQLASQLDAEKRLSARTLAQVEVLSQQIAALRRQLAVLEDALDASEKKDRESQSKITDLISIVRVLIAVFLLLARDGRSRVGGSITFSLKQISGRRQADALMHKSRPGRASPGRFAIRGVRPIGHVV